MTGVEPAALDGAERQSARHPQRRGRDRRSPTAGRRGTAPRPRPQPLAAGPGPGGPNRGPGGQAVCSRTTCWRVAVAPPTGRATAPVAAPPRPPRPRPGRPTRPDPEVPAWYPPPLPAAWICRDPGLHGPSVVRSCVPITCHGPGRGSHDRANEHGARSRVARRPTTRSATWRELQEPVDDRRSPVTPVPDRRSVFDPTRSTRLLDVDPADRSPCSTTPVSYSVEGTSASSAAEPVSGDASSGPPTYPAAGCSVSTS